MNVELKDIIPALGAALHKHNPNARSVHVLLDTVSPSSDEGDTYRLVGQMGIDYSVAPQIQKPVFQVNPNSNLFSDYPNGFAVFEVSGIQRVDGTSTAFVVRVGNIPERKYQVRAASTVEGIPDEAIKYFYLALRNVNTALPEYDTLSETKRRLLASQMNTLYLTMKM